VPGTTVAVVDGAVANDAALDKAALDDAGEPAPASVVGFVTVRGEEVEQLFVAATHRGSGIASDLLSAAEDRIAAAGYAEAWLAVVAGNARARRFYERAGWFDGGPLDYQAETPEGPVPVSTRRYLRRLR
jgi:GNAT superfamily N-acetyltransferase